MAPESKPNSVATRARYPSNYKCWRSLSELSPSPGSSPATCPGSPPLGGDRAGRNWVTRYRRLDSFGSGLDRLGAFPLLPIILGVVDCADCEWCNGFGRYSPHDVALLEVACEATVECLRVRLDAFWSLPSLDKLVSLRQSRGSLFVFGLCVAQTSLALSACCA